MAARRLQCWQCGTAFYGRADARYCCGACRQKAHRARSRRRGADEGVLAPVSENTVAQARQTRENARAARARAGALRRASSAALAATNRARAD